MANRDPFKFTQREMRRRLKDAKDFLANKERVRFICSAAQICVPGYDPESIDAFLCKAGVDLEILRSYLVTAQSRYKMIVSDNVQLNSESSPTNYVKRDGQPTTVGIVVPILFYPFTSLDITRYAVCWIGTWHHAPVIAWTADSVAKTGSEIKEPPIMCQKLPAHSDLL
jgi:hypothetical protein